MAALLLSAGGAKAGEDIAGRITVSRLAVGQVGTLQLAGAKESCIAASFMNRVLDFHRVGNSLNALLPVDLHCIPGVYPLFLHYEDIGSGEIQEREIPLEIHSTEFYVESLSLPPKMVNFSEDTVRRVKAEKELLQAVAGERRSECFWTEGFVRPIAGEISGFFGSRRILNGEEKSPHLGVDIRAREGEPVLCSNAGRVALVGDFYLTGNTVVVDHGQGIFTIYCHLSKVAVKDGEILARGYVLGEAGSTGRSTGPHLHWAARACAAAVDPLSLIEATKTYR